MTLLQKNRSKEGIVNRPKEDLMTACGRQAVSEAFFASLLITASPVLAGEAVMKAINLWNPDARDGSSGAALLGESIKAALQREAEERLLSLEERAVASLLLPLALRNILHLRRYPRLCFVLRVLLGSTREECARQLQFRVRHVENFTVAAMCELAVSKT